MDIYKLKQHSEVKYLECLLNERMSEEGMALNVINKIENKLKYVHCINGFLTPALRRLLCNLLIKAPFGLCMFCIVSVSIKEIKTCL